MTAFDLRATVRLVLQTTDLRDPSEVADEVVRRVPRNIVIDVLRMTMRDYVRVVMTGTRSDVYAETDAPPQSRPSQKVVGIRDHWHRVLNLRVAPDGTTWKLYGECTRDDVLLLARDRRDKAERLNARAAEYEHVARLMEQHAASTVADLPRDVVAGLTSGAAA